VPAGHFAPPEDAAKAIATIVHGGVVTAAATMYALEPELPFARGIAAAIAK
jgi:hypothetical protein